MRIFMSDMHNTIPFSFGKAFNEIGHELLLAGHSFQKHDTYKINYGRKWTQGEADNGLRMSNVHIVEVEELFDNPPDIIMIMCDMVETDVLKIWSELKTRSKLVYYSGNDNQPYNFNILQNLLAADQATYDRAIRVGKHVLKYWPWIDYESFRYEGPSDSRIVRTYIHNYPRLFRVGHQIATQAMQTVTDIEWEVIDNTPKNKTPQLMRDSVATLHIKELEGYGYAIIESLACGRPVILYKPFTRNRTFMNWCIDEQTAIIFNSVPDFKERITQYMKDDVRVAMQEKCQTVIRQKINNQEQTANLKQFLENLR